MTDDIKNGDEVLVLTSTHNGLFYELRGHIYVGILPFEPKGHVVYDKAINEVSIVWGVKKKTITFENDEPVICRMHPEGQVYRRHYSKFKHDKHWVWNDGYTSHTTSSCEHFPIIEKNK